MPTRSRASENSGIFSREAGRLSAIISSSKGDSEDPAELYRNFMGRDPDERAARTLGPCLISSAKSTGR